MLELVSSELLMRHGSTRPKHILLMRETLQVLLKILLLHLPHHLQRTPLLSFKKLGIIHLARPLKIILDLLPHPLQLDVISLPPMFELIFSDLLGKSLIFLLLLTSEPPIQELILHISLTDALLITLFFQIDSIYQLLLFQYELPPVNGGFKINILGITAHIHLVSLPCHIVNFGLSIELSFPKIQRMTYLGGSQFLFNRHLGKSCIGKSPHPENFRKLLPLKLLILKALFYGFEIIFGYQNVSLKAQKGFFQFQIASCLPDSLHVAVVLIELLHFLFVQKFVLVDIVQSGLEFIRGPCFSHPLTIFLRFKPILELVRANHAIHFTLGQIELLTGKTQAVETLIMGPNFNDSGDLDAAQGIILAKHILFQHIKSRVRNSSFINGDIPQLVTEKRFDNRIGSSLDIGDAHTFLSQHKVGNEILEIRNPELDVETDLDIDICRRNPIRLESKTTVFIRFRTERGRKFPISLEIDRDDRLSSYPSRYCLDTVLSFFSFLSLLAFLSSHEESDNSSDGPSKEIVFFLFFVLKDFFCHLLRHLFGGERIKSARKLGNFLAIHINDGRCALLNEYPF